MFEVLRHFGLGPQMMRWIQSAYNNPRACVKANSVLSDPFRILNGACQGCPLSPLLFALSLEPFLIRVRSNPDISGVPVGATSYKVSAYADDLLFSLSQPLVSLPNLLKEFELYGMVISRSITPRRRSWGWLCHLRSVSCPSTSPLNGRR